MIAFAYFVLVNQWLIGGLGSWFGILGVPLSNNPFHKGIPGIQTTNPNHQVTIIDLYRYTVELGKRLKDILPNRGLMINSMVHSVKIHLT